ncbi:MAG: AraC family transcriptional regulator [bacterium]|nr:AraC family transcriptional regulator [bacterium]
MPGVPVKIIIDFGLGFCCILTIASLCKKTEFKIAARSYGALAFVIGLSLLPFVFLNYSIHCNTLVELLLTIGCPFFIGPLVCLYADSAASGESDWESNYIKHFLHIPIIFIFILVLFFNNNRDVIDVFLHGNIYSGSYNGSSVYALVRKLAIAAQYYHFLVYFFLALKRFYVKFRKDDEKKLGILFSIIYVFAIVVFSLPVFISPLYIPIVFAFGVCLLSVHYIISQRVFAPAGFRTPAPDRGVGRTPELLPGQEDIVRRLNEKLQVEKIYLYEDLSLSMLANELDIQPHQLSQLLNYHLGQNFNYLINSYRVRDAKHMLAHDPDKSILSIAFEVGFNSKSSFNRVFRKIIKLSPSEYRNLFSSLINDKFL